MTHNYGGRKPMLVVDNPNLTIHALDSVPENRPKGSWTNGIKAHSKDGGVVGWFFPPRTRNRGHNARSGLKPRSSRVVPIQEEE